MSREQLIGKHVERIFAAYSYYPGIYLEELRETTKDSSQDYQCPG
jgi:hypothetical protein